MPSESVRQPGRQDRASVSEEHVWAPVNPPTRLGEQLAVRIADLIAHGEFSNGDRLPAETELAERFGVSRPVIREALSRLRLTGVIVSRKGSGSYVQKRSDLPPRVVDPVGFGPVNSLAEVRKCYEFRMGIEGEAAYFAAQNRTSEMLQIMREALERMETASAQGRVGMSADFEFHIAVARASGNEFFEIVMQAMRTPIEFAINLGRSLSLTRPREHLRTVQMEHVVMLEAIATQDKDAARLAMRTHIQNACSRVFEGPGSGGKQHAPDGHERI
jgi:GntR family transcriptional regulator, transcriptional repressor for pyruvate dehydrogenase complex